MLSIHNVTNAKQAASYFSKDDYYLDHEQREPSAWWGRGAAKLGLSGAVDRDDFFKLLSGELPNGTRLPGAEPPKPATDAAPDDAPASVEAQARRAGLDLTFSAPKSVSLLALVGGHDQAVRAHDAAVEAALGYLEATTARARITVGEDTQFEATGNFVVARFSHDTSRRQDPQLHTHCVLLNMTERSDNAWRAISNEEIYRSKMAAGVVYRAELAKGLRQAGYELRQTHSDGRFEVGKFTEHQLEHFSQRRTDIEAKLQDSLVSDAKAAERATLLTREAKRDVAREELGAQWSARAASLEIDFSEAAAVRGVPHESLRQREIDEALQFAVQHMTERQVAFEERDLIRHALPLLLGKGGYEDLKRTIGRDAGLGRLIDLGSPQPGAPRRFTTHAAVAIEHNFLERVRAARGQCSPLVDRGLVSAGDAGPRLTEGQRQAAELILTTSDRVVGVQGYAGTGKSTLLRRVSQLAQAEGCAVRGFAPSAVAARVLQEQAGIDSQTLASHLLKPPSCDPAADKPEMWIIDEASMLGNRDALRLLRAADRAKARVVLLGDKDQLPSVEAGKVFDLLMKQGMQCVHMREILRQDDPTLKQAVRETIDRQPSKALATLKPRIVVAGDDADRYSQVASEYLDRASSDRENTLVITPSRADARAITDRIRAGLKERQELPEGELPARILVSADFTEAQTRQPACYEQGMQVRFRRAYKRLGVEAGEGWQVSEVDTRKGAVKLTHEDGRQVDWLPSRMAKVEVYRNESRGVAVGDLVRWTRNDKETDLRNGDVGRVTGLDSLTKQATIDFQGESRHVDLARHRHWDHGYVATAYGAQGKTAASAIIHLDTRRGQALGFESWYVGLSRARSDVSIYTNSEAGLPKAIQKSMQKESALHVLDPRKMIDVRIEGALAFQLASR